MAKDAMEDLFEPISLGPIKLENRFIFPPVKLAYGNPDGAVTDRQLSFYRQIAQNGPGLIVLEPVSVTPEGKEHPKQLCIHLAESEAEMTKLVDVIHGRGRLACLHLNHAGAAANPMATKTKPLAPSRMICPASGQESQALTIEEIEVILKGYRSAAEKGLRAGFDAIEIQAGHGYLLSQFLNRNTNKREDAYGLDRLLFAKEVLSAVREGAPSVPMIARVSGNEMSPEFGICGEDLLPFVKMAEEKGVVALHAGMGHACFSPPWYFHHTSLPRKPQTDALSRLRKHTALPLIAAGRMGRRNRVLEIMGLGLADLIALGRPLVADPGLLEKWRTGKDEEILHCGYCLQGCLHRVKNGEPLGCNVNPEIGMPALTPTDHPLKVLVAGGGPAGMSAALYMTRRGHQVTLAEKMDHLGGQFALAWQAPGKEEMKEGLAGLERAVKKSAFSIQTNRPVDPTLVNEVRPALLVWATGAVQNIPDIPGLKDQYTMTAVELFKGGNVVRGPRVLVIGAGRSGLEVAEKLAKQGYEVVATKRTDPIGSMMEMITRNLTLKRIEGMKNITLMPHTTVVAFTEKKVDVDQDGVRISLEPFQTVVLASGMVSAPGPEETLRNAVPETTVIGDAAEVRDVFSAMQAGYRLALHY